MIPYVITWDGLVTKYHKKYRKKIGIQPKTEAYIQSLVLKKTLESISFERRHGLEEDDGHNEVEALVTKIGLTTKIQSYIQFIVLKKTLERIFYEYRREGVEMIPGWKKNIDFDRLERTSGDDARMEEKIEFDRDKRLDAHDGELAMKQETIS
ncbi:hypothetical protein ACJJTC_000393 [Scirpophaga incertulas]